MHFRCISSPNLSSLFILKQLKRSVEVMKDFDKNFALNMHQLLISTSIHNIVPVTDQKVVIKVHQNNV
jgi:hypothetical protein